jgi:hypothetical protein
VQPNCQEEQDNCPNDRRKTEGIRHRCGRRGSGSTRRNLRDGPGQPDVGVIGHRGKQTLIEGTG